MFVCAILLLAGCKKAKLNSNATGDLASETKIDPCRLLTKDEIAAVQGSVVKEVKSSAQVNNGFRAAQCFYVATEFSRSVVLTVTQRDWEHPISRTPRDFWNDTFHRDADQEKGKKGGGEEEEERGSSAKKIDGVGEEAYWTGARFGGALYALKKDIFIRISVGGSDNEQSKLDHSKALAIKALQHL